MKRKFEEIETPLENEDEHAHRRKRQHTLETQIDDLKKEIKVLHESLNELKQQFLLLWKENESNIYFIRKLQEENNYLNLQNNFQKSNQLFNNYIF